MTFRGNEKWRPSERTIKEVAHTSKNGKNCLKRIWIEKSETEKVEKRNIVNCSWYRRTALMIEMFFFKKNTRPLCSFISVFFKQTLAQFLRLINVKNNHPVSGAGIRTHNLLINSLHQCDQIGRFIGLWATF